MNTPDLFFLCVSDYRSTHILTAFKTVKHAGKQAEMLLDRKFGRDAPHILIVICPSPSCLFNGNTIGRVYKEFLP